MRSSLLRLPARTRLVLVALAVAFGAGLAAGAASAQSFEMPETITPEMQEALKGAKDVCEADVRQVCRWVLPGEGRVVRCVFENFDKLSPTCQQTLTELMPQ